MILPTLLVFSLSLVMLVRTTHENLMVEGRQTVEAIRTGLEPVINNTINQNDFFSNTTRMSISIRKLLSGQGISYMDSVFISSMRSMLQSIASTHDYITAIYLYLDDKSLYYSSNGGTLNVANGGDDTWLQYYQKMPSNQESMVVTRSTSRYITQDTTLTIYHRLLLQKGCIVVNISISRFKDMLKTMSYNKNETVYIL